MNNDKLNNAENQSKQIIDIVNEVVNSYCLQLDEYMRAIDRCLLNSTEPLPNDKIHEFILNLSSILYFVNSKQEELGIKDDVSKAIYKQKYNNARSNKSGTVADKDAYASNESQEEQIINVIYNRAYKEVKLKVDSGIEMLNSLKKVLGHRMVEAELSNSKYINTRNDNKW